MGLSYLKSVHGIIRITQVVLICFMVMTLGAVKSIGDTSMLSKFGLGFSFLMSLFMIYSIILGVSSPTKFQHRMLSMESALAMFWTTGWALLYSLGALLFDVYLKKSLKKADLSLNYNISKEPSYNHFIYEVGCVIPTVMAIHQVGFLSILIGIKVKELSSSRPTESPKVSLQALRSSVEREEASPENNEGSDSSDDKFSGFENKDSRIAKVEGGSLATNTESTASLLAAAQEMAVTDDAGNPTEKKERRLSH